MPVLKNSRWERYAQLLAKGKVADKAYVEAGFKRDDGNATRLKNRPEIIARVDEILGRAAKKAEVTAEMVIRELAKIGFSDIRNAVKWGSKAALAEGDTDANHVELIASTVIDDDTAAAIAEVSQNATGGLKVKLHDKRAALVDLGRYLGLFKDKVEHSGIIGITISSDDADL